MASSLLIDNIFPFLLEENGAGCPLRNICCPQDLSHLPFWSVDFVTGSQKCTEPARKKRNYTLKEMQDLECTDRNWQSICELDSEGVIKGTKYMAG